MAIDTKLLTDVYSTVYKALDGDEEKFTALVRALGGDQVNFSDHIYSRQKVRDSIIERVRAGEEIDVAAESDRVGYGKRWIRSLIRAEKQNEE